MANNRKFLMRKIINEIKTWWKNYNTEEESTFSRFIIHPVIFYSLMFGIPIVLVKGFWMLKDHLYSLI